MNTKFILLQRVERITKNGTAPIYIRLTKKSNQFYISTNIVISPKSWNAQKEQVLNNYSLYFEHFQRLEFIKNQINELLTKEVLLKTNYSIDIFKKHIFNNNEIIFFKDVILNEIEKRKNQNSYNTYRSQKSHLNKILLFKKDLKINYIDKDFINDYHNYLIKKGFQKTTISRNLSYLRTFLNWCKEAEIIEKNPFENIKITKGEGKREFLDITELEKLFALYKQNVLLNYHQNILKIFLFACFTGLRYSDIYLLNWSNIDNNFIDITQHKTNERVRIFINDYIKEFLLNETKKDNNKIFRVPTNQVINKNLKIIVAQVRITKNISFHCARHTFATVSLSLKIPIEVISKTLGHTKIATTQIYAKLVDEVKKEHLQKWNDIF